MNPLPYLAHLWAAPAIDPEFTCPAAASGRTTNATGFFDNATVAAAYNSAAAWSAVAVVVIIAICYLATRQSSGPRFDRRWIVSCVVAIVACGALSFSALHFAHTTAAAGTCQSDPNAFAVPLPNDMVLNRTVAGLVWGALAFVVGSAFFTAVFGRMPLMNNGFYHNRGTPWPRLMPGGK